MKAAFLSLVVSAFLMASCVAPPRGGPPHRGGDGGPPPRRGEHQVQLACPPGADPARLDCRHERGRGRGPGEGNWNRAECGQRDCVRDRAGRFVCAARRGGQARYDARREPVCDGGCVPIERAPCSRGN
ncbi:MAG: hypothetical protein LBQ12_10935 [Deltaproteobacteria bacterium]|nr:hypothetical protein [Deltaproteobacteria bacterium]